MPRSHSSNSKSTSPPVQRNHLPFGPIMSSSQIPSYTPSSTSPTFFGTMKEGIALGAGSAVGSRIVSGIFGPPSVEVKTSTSPPTVYGSTSGKSCEVIQTAFNTCIQERKPVDTCEETLQLLNKCLNSSTS